MKIHLGRTATGESIEYDYIPYDSRGILIQGITNSRKTSLVEEISKQLSQINDSEIGTVQQILFDMGPEFGRLRKMDSSFIIVGKEGEIPAAKETAYDLGREARIHGTNLIIQLTSIKTEEDQQEFIDKFLDGFTSLDEPKYWKPVFIVIDEGQKFCTSRQSTSCRDSIVNICERGRKYGITPVIVTQAIKDLYINARIQLSNRIVGYTTEPDQRNTACELLTMEKSESRKFLDLNPGEFITWGSNITKTPKQFMTETTRYSHSEKFEIPAPTQENVESAKRLMQKITTEAVPELVKLKSQLAHVTARLMLIQNGSGLPKDLEAMRKSWIAKGWNDATAKYIEMINGFNERHRGFFSKVKPCQFVIRLIETDGKKILIPGGME